MCYSILIGLVITLITGIFMNARFVGEFPNLKYATQPLLGVSYWGYPLAWIKQVVYPNAPKQIIWFNFVVDWIIWSGIVFAFMKMSFKKQKLQSKRKKKK